VLALFLDLADLSLKVGQTFISLLERHHLVDLEELSGLAFHECVVMRQCIDAEAFVLDCDARKLVGFYLLVMDCVHQRVKKRALAVAVGWAMILILMAIMLVRG
jgi:hypothetical protein